MWYLLTVTNLNRIFYSYSDLMLNVCEGELVVMMCLLLPKYCIRFNLMKVEKRYQLVILEA